MEITHIRAENYQRITHADIAVRAPILLLAGENEQGKTSLADAIYHAVNGTARRVALKKDYKDLVHDGAKKGSVQISVAVPGDEDGLFMVTVPADKRTVSGVDENPLLHYLLDSRRFVHLKADERRNLLFSITGTRIGAKTILEKLAAKGATAEKTKAISATLVGGFAAAHTEAKARASESRGAWKEVAGETYGKLKAEDWQAPVPSYDEGKLAQQEKDYAAAQAKVGDLQREDGANAEKRRTHAQRQERRRALMETLDQTERRQAKLATDQQLVDEWTAKVAETEKAAGAGPKTNPVACPDCGALLDVQGLTLVHHDPKKQGDPQAIALLPTQRQTLERLIGARDRSKEAVELCIQAKSLLADLDAQDEADPLDEKDAALTAAALKAAQETADRVLAALNVQKDARAEAAQAKVKTEKAAKHHKDACEWDQIAEWLAPSGIQAELLKEALDPFNKRLALTAELTGWDLVHLDDDMTIRIAGRAHSLCSASARWRAEAAITEAIAFVSGVKTFLLDEAEILIGPIRLAFLKWMHTLAVNGDVDTAIVIGSFKDKPQCPPTYQVEWVQAGTVGEPLAEAA